MTGFEPRNRGGRSDCSAHCDTHITTAHIFVIITITIIDK